MTAGASSWCEARGKRLCFDDEWTAACAGPEGWSYPYGDTHEPGLCNDDKTNGASNASEIGFRSDGATTYYIMGTGKASAAGKLKILIKSP